MNALEGAPRRLSTWSNSTCRSPPRLCKRCSTPTPVRHRGEPERQNSAADPCQPSHRLCPCRSPRSHASVKAKGIDIIVDAAHSLGTDRFHASVISRSDFVSFQPAQMDRRAARGSRWLPLDIRKRPAPRRHRCPAISATAKVPRETDCPSRVHTGTVNFRHGVDGAHRRRVASADRRPGKAGAPALSAVTIMGELRPRIQGTSRS